MNLTGTGALIRLALRRDRVLLPATLLAVVGMMAASVQATLELYPQGQLPSSLALIYRQPVAMGMYGALPSSGYDALMVHKPALSSLLILVVTVVVLVRRHTRADEESGRLELVRSGVVGRMAPLAAASAVAAGWVVLTVLATVAALAGLGLDREGTVVLGVSWLGLGLTTVGVTAVAAQVTVSARATAGLAAAVMGGLYLLRVVGTVVGSAGWLGWLTPWGWVERSRAYGANQGWVGAVGVVVGVALVAAAFVLQARRDLGAGLLPERRGAAYGRRLGSPVALAWRLARGTVLGWTAGVSVMGAVGGALVGSVMDLFDDPALSELLRAMGGTQVLADAYTVTYLRMVGLAAVAVALVLTLRLRGEEEDGRVELLLAEPVGRWRLVAAQLAVALGGGALVLVVAAGVFGVAATAALGDASHVWRAVAAGLVQLPAMVVLVGVGVLLLGVLPRWSVALTWTVFGYVALVGELGELLRLPDLAQQLSPWQHLPLLPALTWRMAVMGLVGAALVAAGGAAYRRRDIPQ